MTVFRLFLKNDSNDFPETLQNDRPYQYEEARENRTSSSFSVLEIFIHKVQIFVENGQSGVQRSLYISRTVNAMENLIWYSESTENFLSPMSRQIFAYLSSSWRKIDTKKANFHAFFEWFLVIISETTWKISMKLGQKWVKMDTKQLQKTASQNFSPFLRYLGPKWAKSAHNRPDFMDDPKNFRKNFFFCQSFKMVQFAKLSC